MAMAFGSTTLLAWVIEVDPFAAILSGWNLPNVVDTAARMATDVNELDGRIGYQTLLKTESQ